METLFLCLFAGTLGACVGSFLCVVAETTVWDRTFWTRRSMCFSCHRQLRVFELIPLFSFLIQQGTCRGCQASIPRIYPWGEVLLAGLFILSFFYGMEEGGGLSVLRNMIATSILTLTFLTDAKRQEVSPFLLGVGAFGIACLQWISGVPSEESMLLAAFLCGGFFLTQYVLSGGEAMGLGDVFLGVFLGVLVGFPAILLVLLFSYLSGAVVSLIFLLRGTHTGHSRIAFGPFLVVSGIGMLFWGERILALVLHMIE